MTALLRCLAPLAALAAAACAARSGPALRQDAPSAWGERVLVEATALPAVWLERDDEGPTAGDQFEGFGYGLRAAVGDRTRSIGLAYQGFDTETDANDLDLHALCLDGDVRGRLPEVPDLFWFRAGFALGGAWIDASDDDDLQAEATAQLRLGVDFEPTERLMISAGIGGIVFVHPGDTEAYGTFLTLGATLVF